MRQNAETRFHEIRAAYNNAVNAYSEAQQRLLRYKMKHLDAVIHLADWDIKQTCVTITRYQKTPPQRYEPRTFPEKTELLRLKRAKAKAKQENERLKSVNAKRLAEKAELRKELEKLEETCSWQVDSGQARRDVDLESGSDVMLDEAVSELDKYEDGEEIYA
jgi:chromosome segregation ATPase